MNIDFKNLVNKKNFRNIIIIVSLAIGVIVITLCICLSKNNKKTSDFVDEFEKMENVVEEKNDNSKKIYVHIIGEVINPGLIETKESSRIADVINLAGGFTEEADISKVNLAYVVQDGQKIIVPNKNTSEESESNEYITSDAGKGVIESPKGSTDKVNINTATQTELEMVNGIGPSLASKIVAYRDLNGKFKSIEDLQNVSGIGKAKYESIKDNVIV